MTYYAVDIETTSLDFTSGRILGFGYYGASTDKGYLTKVEDIKSWILRHRQDKLIWQNGKFDQKFIYYNTGLWPSNDFDTKLAAYLVPKRPKGLGLGDLCEYYLGIPSYKESDFISDLENKSETEQASYCLEDCQRTFEVAQILVQELVSSNNWEFFNQYFMPLSDFLAKAEYEGFPIDVTKLDEINKKALKKLEEYDNALYTKYENVVKEFEIEAIRKAKAKNKTQPTQDQLESLRKLAKHRFNFGSSAQRLWLLRDRFNLPCKTTKYERGKKKEVYSASIKVIEEYLGQHEIIQELMFLTDIETVERQTKKLLEFVRKDGKIHANINLTSTDTGRSSCSEPNLQNTSNEIEGLEDVGQVRSVFYAPPGYKLVIADAGQIEPRLTAHYSQDTLLLETFRKGQDFYAIIANEVLGLNLPPELLFKKPFKQQYPKERDFGKETGLSLAYGTGPGTFRVRLSKATKQVYSWQQAKDYINIYFNKFSGIKSLRQDCYREVETKGYLDTLLGRKIYISKEEALHKGLNWKIQCSASDLCLITQLWAEAEMKKYNLHGVFLMFVHDEAIYLVPEGEAEEFSGFIKYMFEHGLELYRPDLKLTTPLEAEVVVADTWLEK